MPRWPRTAHGKWLALAVVVAACGMDSPTLPNGENEGQASDRVMVPATGGSDYPDATITADFGTMATETPAWPADPIPTFGSQSPSLSSANVGEFVGLTDSQIAERIRLEFRLMSATPITTVNMIEVSSSNALTVGLSVAGVQLGDPTDLGVLYSGTFRIPLSTGSSVTVPYAAAVIDRRLAVYEDVFFRSFEDMVVRWRQ